MSDPAPTTSETDQPALSRRQLRILSIVSGIVLLLVAGAIVVFIGLRGPSEPTNGTEPAPATPEATVAPTLSCETIISSDDVEVSVPLPVALTTKDTTLRVEPLVPETEAWSYPTERSDVALWVCGTVVNYVVGLEPTAANEALMSQLVPGDEMELQFANGERLLFRFAERREVAAGNDDVLAQRRPQLTLVVAAAETWQVATADYVAEEGPLDPSIPEISGQVGEAVLAGDARVTVTRGYGQGADDLPAGTMHYLVEFSVENAGQAPLATRAFSMRLRDSLGNTYLVSRSASEAGAYGPLSGEIAPGASVQATAGYVVPQPLPPGTLTWTFSPRPGAEAEASIGIPYEGEEDVPTDVETEVAVDDAFFSNDGNVLIIVGQVRNRGAQPLTVEAADVTLSSDAGLSELISTAPPLPWSIEPGQTQVIELQYQRPDTSAALLELLGYSFEIAGLR